MIVTIIYTDEIPINNPRTNEKQTIEIKINTEKY